MLKTNLKSTRHFPFEWVTEIGVAANPDMWYAKANFISDGKGHTELKHNAECGNNELLQNGDLALDWTPKTNRVIFLN